jgi:nucleoside-triphosphatase THEP1
VELASESFRDAVAGVLRRPLPLVATVHALRHPVHGRALKREPSVTVMPVTMRNRDGLARELAAG